MFMGSFFSPDLVYTLFTVYGEFSPFAVTQLYTMTSAQSQTPNALTLPLGPASSSSQPSSFPLVWSSSAIHRPGFVGPYPLWWHLRSL